MMRCIFSAAKIDVPENDHAQRCAEDDEADAFANDLALELGKRQQHIERVAI